MPEGVRIMMSRSRSRLEWFLFCCGALLLLLTVVNTVSAAGEKSDSMKMTPGLQTYTRAHAMHENPPERLGGALKINISQRDGGTRFVLPGARFLDPAVFGTPDNPVGFDPAPFPLLGVPLDLRNTADGMYTFVNKATPFGDMYEVGAGSFTLTAVDATAIDGARTKDKLDFEANFSLPDGSQYRVVCKKLLPHGMAFPTFGGVVTNHLLHGGTGIGTRLMPTEFTYFAFWGIGDIYKDGKLINEDHMIHGMVTEIVRGENYALQFDGGVGNPPQGTTMHLMIPPFKPTPQGMVPDPLKTMFMPFPFVKKQMEAKMAMVMQLPEEQREKKMAMMMEVKEMMEHTKQHVMEATKAGKMYGQPFIHIMFGDLKMSAKR